MSTHNPYLKRNELAVIAIEATRGTAPTPAYTFPWSAKGITTVPGILENESGIGNDHRVSDSAIDVMHSEGPLGGHAREEWIGWVNRGLFTKVTTTALEDGEGQPTGYYQHDFEYDSTEAPATFSIWDQRPSTTRLFKACEFNNAEIMVEAGESGAWLDANVNVKGWPHEDVSPIEAPAADSAEKTFTSRHVKVYLADDEAGLADTSTARIKPRRITLNLDQERTHDHSVGDGTTPELDKGAFDPKGSMVIKYRKTDFEEGYFQNKIHAMRIVIENGDVSITYTGTKVRFRELTDSDDMDTVVTQEISLVFESDHENDGHAITSTVINSVASYEAA